MKQSIIVLTVLVALSQQANAITTSEWQRAPLAFQSGYVWGVVEAMVGIGETEHDQAMGMAYFRCLTDNKINSNAATDMVRRFVLSRSDAMTTPMWANVLRAMAEACNRYLPK